MAKKASGRAGSPLPAEVGSATASSGLSSKLGSFDRRFKNTNLVVIRAQLLPKINLALFCGWPVRENLGQRRNAALDLHDHPHATGILFCHNGSGIGCLIRIAA